MADTRIQHPLDILSNDDDLSVVLDLEDLARMSLDRYQELIHEIEEPTLRAYFFGLYDQRRSAIYAGAR